MTSKSNIEKIRSIPNKNKPNSKKKYLRKNNFRYNTNPNVLNLHNEGHTAFITAKHGHKAKINIITHSKEFYGMPTKELSQNPNKANPSKKKSRYSIPVWENEKYLKDNAKGYWKISKRDNKQIRKDNKKYERTGKWV